MSKNPHFNLEKDKDVAVTFLLLGLNLKTMHFYQQGLAMRRAEKKGRQM